jgi:GAF domain-containing protein
VKGHGDLRAAVAAGAIGGRDAQKALLSSIVNVARAIFGARASSILLHDAECNELVFAAVAGEGEQDLLGTRIPADSGIAGWVLAIGQPLVIEDVANDPRFARDVAESTGYVPKGIMVVPLIHQELTMGVLSVLDRPERSLFTLPEMELLGHFARQAAIAIELAQSATRAGKVLEGEDPLLEDLAAIAESLVAGDDERAEAAAALIGALRTLVE